VRRLSPLLLPFCLLQTSRLRRALAAVEQVAGVKVPRWSGPPGGDPPRLVASAEKIRRELGFRPRHAELHGMVETALRWRREHPKGYGKGH